MNGFLNKSNGAKLFAAALSILVLIVVGPRALSQSTPPASVNPVQKMTDMIDGEVRKVDKEASKITLRHAEINQLDMPAMTMVFRVKDPALLDKVKAGDKVKFKAEGTGGAFTITEIDLAK